MITLTLADDSIAVLSPQYLGSTIATTDFNVSGTTDIADFQTMLTNMQTNVSALTKVEAFRKGDLTGDLAINFNDYIGFRTVYNAAHGAGAFEELLAQVPEPGTLALLMIGGLAFVGRKRRYVYCSVALVVYLIISSPARAITLLSVDVDARSGGTRPASPPPPNTAAGFNSFTLTGNYGTGLANSTGTVGAYSVTLTAVNASGVATGAIDDRVRTTPTTAPTLNPLYQDFILAGTSTGIGGGMNLEISGGSLLPNSQYSVSVYSFDTGTTGGRSATWKDGNSADAVVVNTFFNGAVSPTTDNQYKFTGIAATDATGKLFLKGRSLQSTNVVTMFLNGFEIATPNELTLEVNTVNGAMRILNEQTGNFDASYYEIRSSAGSLNPAAWTSFDDGESGDPVGTGWDEVPASNANLLNELSLTSMATFAPGSVTNFGNAFTVGGTQDVRFYYAAPSETTLRTGLIKYVTTPVGVPGDYNGNGVVDGADYNYWRSRFGNTSGSGSSLGGSGTVPKPTTFAMLMLVTSLAIGLRYTR